MVHAISHDAKLKYVRRVFGFFIPKIELLRLTLEVLQIARELKLMSIPPEQPKPIPMTQK